MGNLYFRNTQTQKRFKVIKIDREAGTITLRGEHAEFSEAYDRDKFKSMGYILEKEQDDAEQ